jgi:NADH-quinone oxidoreductase subunit B
MAMHMQIDARIRPLIVDLGGCCGVAALEIGAPGYDLPGYEGRAYDLAAERANVLIVTGRITPVFAPTLRSLYERLAAPRWVVSVGVCAISGAVYDTLCASQIVPVDVEVPGCPPHPDALWHALAQLPGRRPS